MQFRPTALEGPVLIEHQPFRDDRGWFARTFCAEEFGGAGLPTSFVQCNASFSDRRGTLRGLHYQASPHAEGKLVRCIRGAIYDVAVDLRPGPAQWRWTAVELSADNATALWIPPGFAHGFVTLADRTEVYYQMTAPFCPDAARGWRWNDPTLGIDWPVAEPILSSRDAALPFVSP